MNQFQKTIPLITDPAKLRARALYWIAKRDYSIHDFKVKLEKVCELPELIDALITDFINRDWLNEQRYMEMFVRTKVAMGLGNQRIQQELKQHGLKTDEIVLYIESLEIDWFEQAKSTYQRKFAEKPMDVKQLGRDKFYKEKAKRFRYMSYRGFKPDEIKYSMDSQSDDW
ncbi:regulatory protein RecX [Psychrosphaera aquimarina]|uniref:Regulatory protein RecX n=1 Tax=Psychrosphaera aquimarina TaxID=2044854 RepID=A0ABU3R223_9GAMM|nr:regulatory protein RecX [Psychrosphaera aquimarina]MDU0113363.1 regulatory protein RecX [Psychrosphaera aquimarina]